MAFHSWIPCFPSGSPIDSEQSSAKERERQRHQLRGRVGNWALSSKDLTGHPPYLPEIPPPVRRWPWFLSVRQIPCMFSGTSRQPGYPPFSCTLQFLKRFLMILKHVGVKTMKAIGCRRVIYSVNQIQVEWEKPLILKIYFSKFFLHVHIYDLQWTSDWKINEV